MSRQQVLALNTEMAEKHYFIEHLEEYLKCVWFGLRRVCIHRPNQLCTFYKLYMNLYFYAPPFTEFELRKVFEKFNGHSEKINKVHDLPGHPTYNATFSLVLHDTIAKSQIDENIYNVMSQLVCLF